MIPSAEPFTLFLWLIAALLPVILLVVMTTSGKRLVEARLRATGFVRRGRFHVLRGQGVELRATITRRGSQHWLELEGPRLPEQAPELRMANAAERSGRLRSGDDAFDREVLAVHADPSLGLAWLSADVRATSRGAVAQQARMADGRWRYRAVCTGLVDVHRVADALVAVSAAMATGPQGAKQGLEDLVRNDPDPAVRVRALELLGSHGASGELAQLLLDDPSADVQLAMVRAGHLAMDAWHVLHARGDAQHRAEGAILLARRLASGDVDGIEPTALVEPLLDALAVPTQAHRVPDVLRKLPLPDLLPQVVRRFGENTPAELQPLVAELRDVARPAAQGSVSLVDVAGGELSVAVGDVERPVGGAGRHSPRRRTTE